MKSTVDSSINSNYKMHKLVKYECLECERHFILSMKEINDVESSPGVEPECPYCGTSSVTSVAYLEDPDTLEELGCMGIGHLETRNVVDDSF